MTVFALKCRKVKNNLAGNQWHTGVSIHNVGQTHTSVEKHILQLMQSAHMHYKFNAGRYARRQGGVKIYWCKM